MIMTRCIRLIGVGLASALMLGGCGSPYASIFTAESPMPRLAPTEGWMAQAIQSCPGQFAGWRLIQSYETAHYFLALCQQGERVHLVGYEKENPHVLITAPTQVQDRTIVAEAKPFIYELRQETLTVKKNGVIVVQEPMQ